jgi:hypothetical protein
MDTTSSSSQCNCQFTKHEGGRCQKTSNRTQGPAFIRNRWPNPNYYCRSCVSVLQSPCTNDQLSGACKTSRENQGLEQSDESTANNSQTTSEPPSFNPIITSSGQTSNPWPNSYSASQHQGHGGVVPRITGSAEQITCLCQSVMHQTADIHQPFQCTAATSSNTEVNMCEPCMRVCIPLQTKY